MYIETGVYFTCASDSNCVIPWVEKLFDIAVGKMRMSCSVNDCIAKANLE